MNAYAAEESSDMHTWKLRSLIAAPFLVTALLPGVSRAQICGDLDGSGEITVTDGVNVLRAAAGLDSLCVVDARLCDVDGSGGIGVTDGVNILRAAARLPMSDRCPTRSPAATIVWSGGGDGVSWGVPLNWSPHRVPGLGDHVVIDAANDTELVFDEAVAAVAVESLVTTVPITFASGSLVVTTFARLYADAKLDGGRLEADIVDLASGTLSTTIDEDLRAGRMEVRSGSVFVANAAADFGEMQVHGGGRVTHTAGATSFLLRLSGDLVIHVGGLIDANGLGYGSATGPGAGQSSGVGQSSAGSGGGGHGGAGGDASTLGGDPYGSAMCAEESGSGGGEMGWIPGGPTYCCTERGGAGGGVIRLVVGGRLTVDGNLTANGGDGTSSCAYWGSCWSGGGGAGGSISIEADTVAGSGTIAAAGGTGGVNGGGGGGGRVAIAYRSFEFAGGPIDVSGGGPTPGDRGLLFSCEPDNGGCSACL